MNTRKHIHAHTRQQNHSFSSRHLLQLLCLWRSLSAALIISAWRRNPPILLSSLTINLHPPWLEGLTSANYLQPRRNPCLSDFSQIDRLFCVSVVKLFFPSFCSFHLFLPDQFCVWMIIYSLMGSRAFVKWSMCDYEAVTQITAQMSIQESFNWQHGLCLGENLLVQVKGKSWWLWVKSDVGVT